MVYLSRNIKLDSSSNVRQSRFYRILNYITLATSLQYYSQQHFFLVFCSDENRQKHVDTRCVLNACQIRTSKDHIGRTIGYQITTVLTRKRHVNDNYLCTPTRVAAGYLGTFFCIISCKLDSAIFILILSP